MSAGNTTVQADTTENDSWIRVGSFASVDQAFEHSLVLLALGSGYRIQPAVEMAGVYELEAPVTSEGIARKELRAYQSECQQQSAVTSHGIDHDFGVAVFLIWAIALLVSYKVQVVLPQWQDIGMNSSIDLMHHGQWWRPLTSLFLHADLGHLLANIVTGGLFATVLSRMWGPAICWLAIILCGAVGNAANCFLQYPDAAFSIGASTSVMAALGLLCAHGTYCALIHRDQSGSLRHIIVPLAAGIALFGLTGNSSDPDVNVLGHACGFVAGLLIGLPITWRVLSGTIERRANNIGAF